MSVVINGTTGITSPDFSGAGPSLTGVQAASGPNSSQFSLRNKIINGGMQVAQRGTSISVSGSDTYTLDRWVCVAASANFTVDRVAYTASYPFGYALVCTGAASNTLAQVAQRIEGINTVDLRSAGNVTVSGYCYHTDATTINWVLRYANTTDNFSAVTSISSGSFTSTAANYKYFSFTVAIPAGYANTGLELVFYVNGLAASKQMAFANVQLEAGSIATPFEQRPTGLELSLCQRYFCYFDACIAGVYTTASSGALAQSVAPFPVRMRTAPTIGYGSVYVTYNLTGESLTALSAQSALYQGQIATYTGNYYITRSNNTASAEL